jgi:diacylglycerol kinase (CTP)
MVGSLVLMRDLNIKVSGEATINPLRVLWHISGGIAIILVMIRTYPSTRLAVLALAISIVVFIIIDIIRYTTEAGNAFFWKYLNILTSKKEKRGPNTSFYYSLSILISVMIYSPEIAMGSIICLAVGDTTAGVIGKIFGRHRIWNKSIEGAVANFAVCFVILLFIVPSTPVAFLGALAGALIELIPIPKIDDNISIPLVSGLAMTIVS